MGFSKVFGGVKGAFQKGFQGKGGNALRPIRSYVHGKNAESQKRGGFAGGYGAWTFGNIINAHSSPEEIVEEFGLDREDSQYGNCYSRAYGECYLEAMAQSLFSDASPDDLLDESEVAEKAYEYAIELASQYIAGEIWIPTEIIEWAYYEVSDHNG